ncbi:RDD family protein [Flavobacterium croceum]|uniref:RDD family protein n=1 Tax=Flavobacterium croceum TaxID=370975 RepID=UPI0024A97A4B|nr:RDD family protein [Flavobacterium croceum]
MNEITITTTQNVTINFKIAEFGDRMLAFLIDIGLKLLYFYFLYLLISLLNLKTWVSHLDGMELMAFLLTITLPASLYELIFESLFEGQTIGKKIRKIKVVKIDGYQASFLDYFIRWIASIVETNIIGLIVFLVSKKGQRLGDIAAGTTVISLQNKIRIEHTILEEIDTHYIPLYPLVIKLSDNDVRIIKDTFNTALASQDTATISKLKSKIESVTGEINKSGNTNDFIRTILKDYNYYTQNM